MKVKQNQGFTLIELVVVIIVLAILVATAIPKFMDLKRDANVSVLQGIKGTVESVIQVSQAKALANGLDQYCLVQSNTTNVTDSEYSTFNKNGCIVGYNAAVNTEVFFQTTFSIPTPRVEGIIASFMGEANKYSSSKYQSNASFSELKSRDSASGYRSCGDTSELCYLYLSAMNFPSSNGSHNSNWGQILIVPKNGVGAYFSNGNLSSFDGSQSCAIGYQVRLIYSNKIAIGSEWKVSVYDGGC
jgi:MSHA pilin protein MshA